MQREGAGGAAPPLPACHGCPAAPEPPPAPRLPRPAPPRPQDLPGGPRRRPPGRPHPHQHRLGRPQLALLAGDLPLGGRHQQRHVRRCLRRAAWGWPACTCVAPRGCGPHWPAGVQLAVQRCGGPCPLLSLPSHPLPPTPLSPQLHQRLHEDHGQPQGAGCGGPVGEAPPPPPPTPPCPLPAHVGSLRVAGEPSPGMPSAPPHTSPHAPLAPRRPTPAATPPPSTPSPCRQREDCCRGCRGVAASRPLHAVPPPPSSLPLVSPR